jgi:F-type H+-transporting ATPase subunit b
MNINLTLLGQAIAFGLFIWFTANSWPPLIKAIGPGGGKLPWTGSR